VGIATESGHVTLDDNGPICGCGKVGHLEAFSSGTGIENFVHSELIKGIKSIFPSSSQPSAWQIAEAARNGDSLSKAAFERAGYYLGIGIANYLHIFNPSCVIFGGGVSLSGDLLMIPFQKSLEDHSELVVFEGSGNKVGCLGRHVGLISSRILKDRLSDFLRFLLGNINRNHTKQVNINLLPDIRVRQRLFAGDLQSAHQELDLDASWNSLTIQLKCSQGKLA
jgi:hypothetical protein